MNIHKVYELFLPYFRKKRLHLLYEWLNINPSTSVLDVGGNLFFWTLARNFTVWGLVTEKGIEFLNQLLVLNQNEHSLHI